MRWLVACSLLQEHAEVSYYYTRTAPRAAPAVVTTPVRQIYIVPRAVVPATPLAGYQSFWPNFPVKAANVPLTRPHRRRWSERRGVERLSPTEVYELLRAGQCLVVDVRSADRASGHIKGSVHEPTSFQAPLLNRVPELVAKFSKEKLVIFHCQYSMHRGPQCANWYREQAPTSQRVAVMEGGFRGWERSDCRSSTSNPWMPKCRLVPAVVTMPVRQIYIMPRAPVPATSCWPNFPVKAANLPSAR
eukprot:s8060_g1.t1